MQFSGGSNVCYSSGQDTVMCVMCIWIRHCFLTRATHKFRSEFGKSRLVRDKEKVLVAFSGGPSSSAMVHLIEQVLTT